MTRHRGDPGLRGWITRYSAFPSLHVDQKCGHLRRGRGRPDSIRFTTDVTVRGRQLVICSACGVQAGYRYAAIGVVLGSGDEAEALLRELGGVVDTEDDDRLSPGPS